jgi:hypothetical protein
MGYAKAHVLMFSHASERSYAGNQCYLFLNIGYVEAHVSMFSYAGERSYAGNQCYLFLNIDNISYVKIHVLSHCILESM